MGICDFSRIGGHGFQNFRRGGAGFQSALGGELVDQSVGERIAERHAEFEHVHADFVEGQRQLARGVQVRIARADIDDEAFFSSRFSRANVPRCGSCAGCGIVGSRFQVEGCPIFPRTTLRRDELRVPNFLNWLWLISGTRVSPFRFSGTRKPNFPGIS